MFWEVSGKPALFDEALEQRADPSAFRARIDALVQETLRLFPPIAFYLRVITSYSIHYTKLYESSVQKVPSTITQSAASRRAWTSGVRAPRPGA